MTKHGVNLNYSHSFPEKFLWACKEGNLDLVKAYITLGVDINYKSNDYGKSIGLVKAAEGNHLDIIQYLMENGAIHDGKVDEDGDTGLHTAVNWGHIQAVQKFLDCGASANNLNINQATPLESAIEHGHTSIFQLLTKYADPNAYFEQGLSFAHKCVRNSKFENLFDTFSKFSIKTNPNLKDQNGNNLLHYALVHSGDNNEIIVLILQNGANVNDLNNDGWTPYYIAKYLGFNLSEIEPSADPTIGKEVFDLFNANANQDAATIQLIKERGGNINALSPKGSNLIGESIEKELPDEWIFMLIDLGVDANFEKQKYYNLILQAYEAKRIELAHKMIEKGVNPNHSGGFFGQTQYGIWNKFFDDEMIAEMEYLHSKGAKFTNLNALYGPLIWGDQSESYSIKFVKKIASLGGNLNIYDSFDTALGALCNYYPERYKLVQAMIDCGANVNILDKNHNTPLIIALGCYNEVSSLRKITEILLNAGASFEIEGGFGGNAAYNAFESLSKNSIAVEALVTFYRTN